MQYPVDPMSLYPQPYMPNMMAPYPQQPAMMAPYPQQPAMMAPYPQQPAMMAPYPQQPAMMAPYPQQPFMSGIAPYPQPSPMQGVLPSGVAPRQRPSYIHLPVGQHPQNPEFAQYAPFNFPSANTVNEMQKYADFHEQITMKKRTKLPTPPLPKETMSTFLLYDPVSNAPLKRAPLNLDQRTVILKERKDGRTRNFPPTRVPKGYILAPQKAAKKAAKKQAPGQPKLKGPNLDFTDHEENHLWEASRQFYPAEGPEMMMGYPQPMAPSFVQPEYGLAPSYVQPGYGYPPMAPSYVQPQVY
jgi:hypothetical protein